jgi:hypothetical protein
MMKKLLFFKAAAKVLLLYVSPSFWGNIFVAMLFCVHLPMVFDYFSSKKQTNPKNPPTNTQKQTRKRAQCRTFAAKPTECFSKK